MRRQAVPRPTAPQAPADSKSTSMKRNVGPLRHAQQQHDDGQERHVHRPQREGAADGAGRQAPAETLHVPPPPQGGPDRQRHDGEGHRLHPAGRGGGRAADDHQEDQPARPAGGCDRSMVWNPPVRAETDWNHACGMPGRRRASASPSSTARRRRPRLHGLFELLMQPAGGLHGQQAHRAEQQQRRGGHQHELAVQRQPGRRWLGELRTAASVMPNGLDGPIRHVVQHREAQPPRIINKGITPRLPSGAEDVRLSLWSASRRCRTR